jgi:hypothetical protein
MTDQLTEREYAYFLRNDLRSFIERSFYALNPQTRFEADWHIDVIAAKLEDCLRGKIRRLIFPLRQKALDKVAKMASPQADDFGKYIKADDLTDDQLAAIIAADLEKTKQKNGINMY